MAEKEQIVDQKILAQDVSEKIPFEMLRSFLIKPLDPIMVEKEFSKPIPENTTKDENGIEATDYSKVETEVKTVEANIQKGIVLKVPYEYKMMQERSDSISAKIEVGDVVYYKKSYTQQFDAFKDSVLLSSYDILAIESK